MRNINPVFYIVFSFLLGLLALFGLFGLVSAQTDPFPSLPSLPAGFSYVPVSPSSVESYYNPDWGSFACSLGVGGVVSCSGDEQSWHGVELFGVCSPVGSVGMLAVNSGSGLLYPAIYFANGLTFSGLNQTSASYNSGYPELAIADRNHNAGGLDFSGCFGDSLQGETISGGGSGYWDFQMFAIVDDSLVPTPEPPTPTPSAPSDPAKSPFGLDLTCTHFFTSTGTTVTYSGDLIDNQGFETGGSVPSFWSYPSSFFGFTAVSDSVLSNEGSVSLVYGLDLNSLSSSAVQQSALVSNLRDTYVLDFAYRLGNCPAGSPCQSGRSLAAALDGSYFSVPISYTSPSCSSVGGGIGGAYHQCDWARQIVTYTVPVSVPQPKDFVLSLGSGSASVWLDDVHLYPVDETGTFECIPPDDLLDPSTPTPSPLPTVPPLPTIGPVPTVDVGVGVVPGPVTCLGWNEFNVVSQTVPSLSLCLEPQIVTVSPSHPLADVIPSGVGGIAGVLFSGALVVAVVGYIRRR